MHALWSKVSDNSLLCFFRKSVKFAERHGSAFLTSSIMSLKCKTKHKKETIKGLITEYQYCIEAN